MIFDKIKAKLEPWSTILEVIAGIISVIGAGYSSYTFLFEHSRNLPKPPSIEVVGQTVLILQAVSVAFLIGTPCWPPPISKDTRFENARIASNQFCWSWLVIWVALFFLYVDLSINWHAIYSDNLNSAWGVSLDFFSLLSTACLFLCYLILAFQTVPPKDNGWHRIIFSVLVAGVAILATEYFGPATEKVLDTLIAFLGGVVIALFAGRLESKLMNSPRWIVIALYSYAVLQMAYTGLHGHSPDDKLTFILVASLALPLKVLLFYEVRRIVRTRGLTYYMLEYGKFVTEAPNSRTSILKELEP